GVVLLGAEDVVVRPVVDGDVVELRRRLVVDGGEGGAAVERDVGAAVVALDHALVVTRVDPDVVVVAVGRGDRVEGAPAVVGAMQVQVVHIDRLGVHRVGGDVGVVPGAA